MFRNRPLTWLFLIATICVDIVLMASEEGGQDTSMLGLGFVFGQLAALAIWAARGHLHRLTRASCLVVATGLLTYLVKVDPSPISTWIAFHAAYVFFIVIAAVLSDSLRARSLRQSTGGQSAESWRFSLIECLGWTTVVSIVSFGARHMDFSFIFDGDALLTVIAIMAVPVSIAVLIPYDLRGLPAIRAFGIVAVAVIAASSLAHRGRDGGLVIFVQTAYLVLWLAVRGFDEVKANVRSIHKSLLDEDLQPNEPKLFNPQD